MIEFRTGEILRADAEALVNTVNCVGIMGRGVALQFKNAFPENYRAYETACKRGQVQPGWMFVHDTGYVSNPKYIINFPTKRHWRGRSRIEDIEAGLRDLVDVLKARQIRSVALPPLGSGLGGLPWEVVRRRIERALSELPSVGIVVFEPHESGDRMSPKRRETPRMTAGRAALVGLIRRYLAGLMDPFVTLLEVQKLMYFMQEAGQPLRLRFLEAIYGPYAENLRHVLREVEGYYVAGCWDGGDSPEQELSLVPGAVEEATAFLADDPDTQARFKRVADLVEGFETPVGLELLSTVHWVATHAGTPPTEEVVSGVYAWNERKKQFTPRQIRLALDVLKRQDWLEVETGERHN